MHLLYWGRHRVQRERLALAGAGPSHAAVRLTANREESVLNVAGNGDMQGIHRAKAWEGLSWAQQGGVSLVHKRGRPGVNPTCLVVYYIFAAM